ncbi:MAG: transglycosylase SLT domain-containing protein [Desulfuromonadaceae bacterium]|jgi:soluble lytic murein transglycosylase|nr:transglycosylase SLT domain-containing protein [Desulfuromonas sp.]MDY0184728.1 transglycosylase SLT domain-containing protein [Desulfuromonadaceae bacterium]
MALHTIFTALPIIRNCQAGGITLFCAVLWLYFLCAGAGDVAAAVYKYVDESGRMHFSNVPVESRFIFHCSETVDTSLAGRSVHDLIQYYSHRHKLDPALVKAVVKAESNFDSSCVSKAGARGLMQVLPTTAAEMDIYDLFDPAQNIAAGSRYLQQMLKRFNGDLDLALAAYNAGPSVVERYAGIPPYAETRAYVKNVRIYFDQYRNDLGE